MNRTTYLLDNWIVRKGFNLLLCTAGIGCVSKWVLAHEYNATRISESLVKVFKKGMPRLGDD
jgi:hypothetical protein